MHERNRRRAAGSLWITDLRRLRRLSTTVVVDPRTGAITIRRPIPDLSRPRTTSVVPGWLRAGRRRRQP